MSALRAALIDYEAAIETAYHDGTLDGEEVDESAELLVAAKVELNALEASLNAACGFAWDVGRAEEEQRLVRTYACCGSCVSDEEGCGGFERDEDEPCCAHTAAQWAARRAWLRDR